MEQMDKVSGGAIYNNRGDIMDDKPFQVINDANGDILARFKTQADAEAYAKKVGIGTNQVRLSDIMKMRGH